MLFNSFSYAVFVPIIFIIYWFMPHRFRWVLLLAASYYFYMSWNPKYIILILATTFISYITGIVIEQTENKLQKKVYLVLSVIFCMGILFIFKYFNFFIENLSSVLDIFTIKMHPITLKLLLPVGISFYTFQTMSYVIDVYRGDVQAEKHFGYYAAFISFFPQLVAGPIERTSNLLPQIKREQKFSEQKAFDGLKLMLWGYYKKLVVADTLAPYVDKVYNQLELYQGFSLMIVVFFFSLQIYCDFSGYSDIAIGTARLFGIDLIKNFDAPYFSKSVKEFWRRWHISLSTWFRDYIYISLGGNKCSRIKRYFNLMITFLISGLWHGANWTFLYWGGVHGVAQIIEDICNPILKKIRLYKVGKFVTWILVFFFCNMAWVLFRAPTLIDAIYVYKNILIDIDTPLRYLKNGFNDIGISVVRLIHLVTLIIILIVVDGINLRNNIVVKVNSQKVIVQWCVYLLLALITILFAQKGVAAEFVYFQF